MMGFARGGQHRTMFARQLPIHSCPAWFRRARTKQSLLLLLVCFFTFVGCVQSHRVLSRLFPRPSGMLALDTHATSEAPRNRQYTSDRLCQPERLRAHGKFLFLGEEKVYLKGATYGTFQPLNGTQFPSPQNVSRDFALMAAAGMNAVRVYTPPPRWLLDSAQESGLLVMVGLPWEQHLSFLDYPWLMDSIVQRVEESTKELAGHPALGIYAIGNEIPFDIVRWYGMDRIRPFLQTLCQAVKRQDPRALVTYGNYPTTEYLGEGAPCADVVSFNVYLDRLPEFAAYLGRLQNIAGAKPLLLAEVGLDSKQHGAERQAQFLGEQVPMAFAQGVAGAFVYAWTDEWFRGGEHVLGWDFGLVTRDRQPKPALSTVAAAFRHVPFNSNMSWPTVTVVVCAHNSDGTIRRTCRALSQVVYTSKAWEVVFVDDGSTDMTRLIIKSYCSFIIPRVRVVSIAQNCGLSCARNAGLHAAVGEIVAYTDADAMPDPHWLQYLAFSFMSNDKHMAAGGQSLAPLGFGAVADSLAFAPGGAAHVLLTDTVAEHIAGCNSAFRRDILLQLGGWDHLFRVAGDDVDMVWRVQDAGGSVGFHAAAVVWHKRRPTLKTFLHQQWEYGKSEAMVEMRHPARFTDSGHMKWAGHIYGAISEALPAAVPIVKHGVWGREPFQFLYQGPAATGFQHAIVQASRGLLLWSTAVVVVGVATKWKRMTRIAMCLLCFCTGVLFLTSWHDARVTAATHLHDSYPCLSRAYATAMLTMANFLQPTARDLGFFMFWKTMAPTAKPGLFIFFPTATTTGHFQHSNSSSFNRDILPDLELTLKQRGYAVLRGDEHSRHDLQIRYTRTTGAKARVLVEYYGSGKRFVRVNAYPYIASELITWCAVLLAVAAAAWLDGAHAAAGVVSCALACLVISAYVGCCRGMSAFVESFLSVS